MAILFFFYYNQIAGYWLDREIVDPLVANFVIAPMLFGFVAFAGLRGELLEKPGS